MKYFSNAFAIRPLLAFVSADAADSAHAFIPKGERRDLLGALAHERARPLGVVTWRRRR